MIDAEAKQNMQRMVIALTLVAVISTILLGFTDILTRKPIQKAQRAMLMHSLQQVLPPHANHPVDDQLLLHIHAKDVPVFIARNAKDAVSAFAWEVVAPDGYQGSIRILMSVTPTGAIHAIRITGHQETPGLGDGIVHNQPWIHAFTGRTLGNTHWGVKKDGGDFDQFTGATITPRAVIKAIKKGLEFFHTHQKKMLKKAENHD